MAYAIFFFCPRILRIERIESSNAAFFGGKAVQSHVERVAKIREIGVIRGQKKVIARQLVVKYF